MITYPVILSHGFLFPQGICWFPTKYICSEKMFQPSCKSGMPNKILLMGFRDNKEQNTDMICQSELPTAGIIQVKETLPPKLSDLLALGKTRYNKHYLCSPSPTDQTPPGNHLFQQNEIAHGSGPVRWVETSFSGDLLNQRTRGVIMLKTS